MDPPIHKVEIVEVNGLFVVKVLGNLEFIKQFFREFLEDNPSDTDD